MASLASVSTREIHTETGTVGPGAPGHRQGPGRGQYGGLGMGKRELPRKLHLECGLVTPSGWVNVDASWNA
jgi:hypothetical protein